MTDTLKKEFWDRLEDTRTGMLSAEGARAVPMSHYVDDDDSPQAIWFITAKGTDLSNAAATGETAQYIVSSNDEQLYARIDGRISVSNDPQKLDEMWNAIASAWFDGGQQDPDVQLIRFDLTEAEVWATGGSLKFLFEVAKAHMTDSKPDMGEHGTLHFASAA
ncbi:pyridoxamine 5'-phosphate oxidase family protein [Sulfitobacter aestuariivivens]|uniref:Pyridoxamine 5'-phosphate oxidase family protein n=1 Tax=Sulfitobacter aestuariivivens TaxID=2766981 RepID=A0A927D1Y1_9RHOB|nr:pyridoxamine 5'-phosphate oxidase family protein [Sulfitobacter aestuariivivens]MBD3663588.1 pyridoxamine 5'-phosphate oxidase family protein [Sulfitobacter aestuariivivens]